MRTALLMTKAQIGRDTLRYYERKGIITPPPRAANGYRDYPDSTVDVIRFIRLGQSVGLSLDVIRRAIPFVKAPVPGCPQLRAALETQLASVETQLRKLNGARERLRKWIRVNLAEAMARTRQACSAAGTKPASADHP
jgi:DNA-binding transcriptional MerR regulator